MTKKEIIFKLSEMHYKLLSKNDLSKFLGIDLIQTFYSILLEEKYGKVFYETNHKGDVISICCGFYRYKDFKKKYMRVTLVKVFFKIITFKVSIKKILNELFSKLPNEIIDNQNFALGFIGFTKDHGIRGPISLAKNYSKTLKYLINHDCNYVWGSTLTENIGANQFLSRNNFKIVGENFNGKNYYILKL